MKKKINIIARSNGVGLDSDLTLLTEILESAQYQVAYSHYRSRNLLQKWLTKKPQYDVNIFLERVFPNWYGTAKKNILIPNQERFPRRHIARLTEIDYVFCKSQHAQSIFSDLDLPSQYIGFTSKDIELSNTQTDYNHFFHLAGSSTLKGTDTILKLWRKHPEWPPLTVLQHKHNAPETVPSNVTLITDHISYTELTTIANQIGIHLCTSLSEGWGHYIVEAMSCKALVITTDAPPMNELISNDRGVTVPYNHSELRHLGTNFYIDENKLESKIQEIISMKPQDKSSLGEKARKWYDENNTRFTENLLKAIKTTL